MCGGCNNAWLTVRTVWDPLGGTFVVGARQPERILLISMVDGRHMSDSSQRDSSFDLQSIPRIAKMDGHRTLDIVTTMIPTKFLRRRTKTRTAHVACEIQFPAP